MWFTLPFLIKILPFAFALHNIEEVFFMERWSKSVPDYLHKPVSTLQFAIPVILFTLLGFLVVFAKEWYPSEKIYHYGIAGFSGMLFLNVFLPHLVATILLKRYAAGAITAVFINLPLTVSIFIKLKQLQLLSSSEIIISVLVGGLTGLGLAFLFLAIGKLAVRTAVK